MDSDFLSYQELWRSVIYCALLDITEPNEELRQEALMWFFTDNPDFPYVCALADAETSIVRRKALTAFLKSGYPEPDWEPAGFKRIKHISYLAENATPRSFLYNDIKINAYQTPTELCWQLNGIQSALKYKSLIRAQNAIPLCRLRKRIDIYKSKKRTIFFATEDGIQDIIDVMNFPWSNHERKFFLWLQEDYQKAEILNDVSSVLYQKNHIHFFKFNNEIRWSFSDVVNIIIRNIDADFREIIQEEEKKLQQKRANATDKLKCIKYICRRQNIISSNELNATFLTTEKLIEFFNRIPNKNYSDFINFIQAADNEIIGENKCKE